MHASSGSSAQQGAQEAEAPPPLHLKNAWRVLLRALFTQGHFQDAPSDRWDATCVCSPASGQSRHALPLLLALLLLLLLWPTGFQGLACTRCNRRMEECIQEYTAVKQALLAFSRARPDALFALEPGSLQAIAQVRCPWTLLISCARTTHFCSEGLCQYGPRLPPLPPANAALVEHTRCKQQYKSSCSPSGGRSPPCPELASALRTVRAQAPLLPPARGGRIERKLANADARMKATYAQDSLRLAHAPAQGAASTQVRGCRVCVHVCVCVCVRVGACVFMRWVCVCHHPPSPSLGPYWSPLLP